MKTKCNLRLLLVLIFMVTSVGANEIDWSNYNTEKDLATLTEEQLNSMPMSVFFRIFNDEGNTKELIDNGLVLGLSQMGYFLDTNPRVIKQKIKDFQETIGSEPTGELTYGDFNKLSECMSRASENKVIPLGNTTVYIGDTYLNATANLVIDDGNDIYLEETDSALPVTESQIRCYKNEGICNVFVADVVIPRFDEFNNTYYLNTNVDIWNIDSWTKDKVVASQSSKCRSTTMTINGASEEIVQITTNSSKEECEILGTTLPKLDRPRVVKSVDPMKYTSGYWRARADKFREMCISESIIELVGKSFEK